MYASDNKSHLLRHIARNGSTCVPPSEESLKAMVESAEFPCRYPGCTMKYTICTNRLRHEKKCPCNPNRKVSDSATPLNDVSSVTEISFIEPVLNNENKVGFIYLIREREFFITRQHVYKVGSTIQQGGQHRIHRFQDYKKGSELIFMWQCVDPSKVREVESRIIQELSKEFDRHIDGREHFKGNRFLMTNVITSITSEYDRLFATAENTTL